MKIDVLFGNVRRNARTSHFMRPSSTHVNRGNRGRTLKTMAKKTGKAMPYIFQKNIFRRDLGGGNHLPRGVIRISDNTETNRRNIGFGSSIA
jgi:hypothetical protein